MKKTVVFILGLLFASVMSVYAEAPAATSSDDAANPLMKEPRVSEPAAVRANSTARKEGKTIFDYKSELKLSDNQENKIKAVVYDHESTLKGSLGKVKQLRAELIKILDQKGQLSDVKAKLDEIGKVQVDIWYDDIATSRKIEDTLLPDQLSRWKDIQKAAAGKS